MKKKVITDINKLVVWIILLMVSMAAAAHGDYALDWYTIDGGGGRSTGGPYTLTGTIGQPDAAYSRGGNYELLGGFWPGGPLCFVEFEDFAKFAEQWWLKGTGLTSDLYEDLDNQVNWLDLKVFVEQWLCYCPIGWPLK
jgi:hypothetical protein